MSKRTDPFREIERLVTEMSSGFDVPGDKLAVDLVDQGDAFTLRVDLPGYEADDINLQITNGRQVTIEASRSTEIEAENDSFVKRERRQEQVSRTVTLPATVEEDETEASYTAGVLDVHLPKREAEGDGTNIPVN